MNDIMLSLSFPLLVCSFSNPSLHLPFCIYTIISDYSSLMKKQNVYTKYITFLLIQSICKLYCIHKCTNCTNMLNTQNVCSHEL